MNYETPAWVKDYADPEMLDWYKRALEVVEVHSAANLEEMTQEEFEEHNKIGVILLKTFTEHHIYIGLLNNKLGNSYLSVIIV